MAKIGAGISALTIALWLVVILTPEQTNDPQQVPLGHAFATIFAVCLLALFWFGVFIAHIARAASRAAQDLTAEPDDDRFANRS